MRKIKLPVWKTLNIKWKLTLWSAFHLILLFFFYNLLQFSILQGWVHNHEKDIIRKNMEEAVVYLHSIEASGKVTDSRYYLNVLNERHQLIRIVNERNVPVVTVTNKVDEDWVAPRYADMEPEEQTSPTGDTLLVYRQPIDFGSERFTVEIVRNMENFESLITLITSLLVATGLISIVLSLIGGRMIAYQLLNPINAMIRTMKGIREKGLKERVQIRNPQDELTELSTMFNELMDSLSKSFDQQQQFIEDASHELKTPLAIIHGHLSLIKRWGKDDPEVLERSIQLSLNETNRLIHMVSELLILTRADGADASVYGPPGPIKIRPAVEEIVENFQTLNPEFRISVQLELTGDFMLPVRKSHLQQLLIILFDNAIKHARESKEIRVAAEAENEVVKLSVKDYGAGIPQEDLPLVTNRFYRVDKARSRKEGGNGLGLSIAKRLLDDYGGRLEIDSVYGEWTEVTIHFPLTQAASESPIKE